jgi:pSer/pThr/pTyr-binding forkhead associated (FHA) protein
MCIEDNPAISRCHMKIMKRGMDYYVVDLNSTNETYVNNCRVMPGEEKLIQNKDMIKIADEEMIFEIK